MPVGALAITSCQSIIGGMQPAWTGVDTSMLRFSMARMISGDRCRLSNRTPSVNSMALFLFRLSVGLAGAAAPVDHGHYQDYQCQQG